MELSFKEFLLQEEQLNELQSAQEMREVENGLSQMFRDVAPNGATFTGHGGRDRALGREDDVTPSELSDLFFKFKKMHASKIVSELKRRGRFQAVIKDYGKKLNVVVDIDGGQLKIVTMARKAPNQFKGDKWPEFLQLKVW